MQVILRDGQLRVEQVRSSTRTPLVTALLHGALRCHHAEPLAC